MILGAAILGIGIALSLAGRASLIGVIIVGVIFFLVPVAVMLSNRRLLNRATAQISANGTTQMVVDATGVRLADTFIPYERITFVAAFVQGEQYSSGGLAGEYMAYNLGQAENRPTLGRAAGAVIGTMQRRKLYRDGAKSTISLAFGIDRRSTIDAPNGMINPLKTLPHRGDDPGRIDVPFGAFLDGRELEFALGTIYRLSGGHQFPVGIVSGSFDWAIATTSAGETREEIWQTFAKFFANS